MERFLAESEERLETMVRVSAGYGLFFLNLARRVKISRLIFFGAQIPGIVSGFRSDESFPVKTGSCRKIMVDPLIEPQF